MFALSDGSTSILLILQEESSRLRRENQPLDRSPKAFKMSNACTSIQTMNHARPQTETMFAQTKLFCGLPWAMGQVQRCESP